MRTLSHRAVAFGVALVSPLAVGLLPASARAAGDPSRPSAAGSASTKRQAAPAGQAAPPPESHTTDDSDDDEDDDDDDDDGAPDTDGDAAKGQPAPGEQVARPPGSSSGDDSDDDDGDDDDDEDSGPTLGAEADALTRSIWRGLALSQGPVLQPSAWFSLHGFNVSLWGNVLLTDHAASPLSVVVPSVSYDFRWKELTIEPGLTYYAALEGTPLDGTAEATLEATLTLGDFAIVSDHYVDIAAQPGAYYGTVGGQYAPSFGKWTLGAKADLGWATAGYNDAYFGSSSAALNLVEGTVSVRYELSSIAYAVLHADGSTLLSPSLRAGVAQPTLGAAGATLGVEL